MFKDIFWVGWVDPPKLKGQAKRSGWDLWLCVVLLKCPGVCLEVAFIIYWMNRGNQTTNGTKFLKKTNKSKKQTSSQTPTKNIEKNKLNNTKCENCPTHFLQPKPKNTNSRCNMVV